MNFRNIVRGVILIVLGMMFLIEELTGFDFKGYFWPLILIIIGVLLMLKNIINSDPSNRTNI